MTVAKTGAWGQGPVLLQALAILAGFEPHEIDPSTADGAHRVLEALKLALADRDAYYGDPDAGTGVPARRAALRRVRRRAGGADRRRRRSHDFRPGDVAGRPPYRPTAGDRPDEPTAGRRAPASRPCR